VESDSEIGVPMLYVYDDANRLTSVVGVSYTWENNGNLLHDGSKYYTYNRANRLAMVGLSPTQVSNKFYYNGLGDRPRFQNTTGLPGVTVDYVNDIATGLSQILVISL
jgi:hypothetical protein